METASNYVKLHITTYRIQCNLKTPDRYTRDPVTTPQQVCSVAEVLDGDPPPPVNSNVRET